MKYPKGQLVEVVELLSPEAVPVGTRFTVSKSKRGILLLGSSLKVKPLLGIIYNTGLPSSMYENKYRWVTEGAIKAVKKVRK